MKKFLLILAAVFCCTLGVNAQETPDYFCITNTATTSGSFTFKKNGSLWTKDLPKLEYYDGEKWQNVTIGTGVSIPANTSYYFRAGEDSNPTTNASFSEDESNYISISTFKTYRVSGNIMSLLDGTDFETLTTVPDYAFYRLFPLAGSANNTYLKDISNLRLPATNLGAYCYSYMFYKCTDITTAPKLPAPILKDHCYSYMFNGCGSLCDIEVNFTKWPGISGDDVWATQSWLNSVASSGTFTCPGDLTPEGGSYYGSGKIPEGWKVDHPTNFITLNDNEAYTGAKDKTATVTYNRTFTTANLWEPLYVPFSITITEDLLSKCDIADIYMVSKGSGVYSGKDVTVVRKMSAEETTIAHTPYFIRAKASGDFTFTQENTLVKAAPQTPSIIDCSTTKDKYEFIGSYSGETLNPASGDFYILDAEGALTKISEETTLPFNRWYMKKTSRQIQPIGANLAPSMPILTIGEDDTTGIIGLDEVKTNANDKLYNMMGVAVEAGRASLPAGVYLQHGKKFIIK